MAITEGILRMIAADDSHAGSLTVARRGTGGHLQTPGLAAPEHSDAERPAPHLGQDGRVCAYGSPDSRKESLRLLRGQLAGRDNTPARAS